MEVIKSYRDLTVKAIKSLYADLKKDRTVVTWGEFADRIDYDRTYVSRVVNGHESLTEDFQKAIFTNFVVPTPNVVFATSIQQKIEPPKLDQVAVVISKGDLDALANKITELLHLKDRVTNTDQNVTKLLHALENLGTQLQSEREVVLASLGRLEGTPEHALLTEAYKKTARKGQQNRKRSKQPVAGKIDKAL